MSAPAKIIRLKYPTRERFIKDYPRLARGELFIPTQKPAAQGAVLIVEVHAPEIEGAFNLDCMVDASLTPQLAKSLGKNPGMDLKVMERSIETLGLLEDTLRGHQVYREALGLSEAQGPLTGVEAGEEGHGADEPVHPGQAGEEAPEEEEAETLEEAEEEEEWMAEARSRVSGPPEAKESGEPASQEAGKEEGRLKLEWVREIIGQEEMEVEEEEEPEEIPPPRKEKKELSSEERERVQPSGEFIMDLTKAMLRSGYYSPDHPESQQAKTGLYEELEKALGDSKEIMLTAEELQGKFDVLITGILNEPLSVRTVVGAGMAELFMPKLREYFDRKALVGLAIKRDISPEHFDSFVDVMSDPKADKGEGTQVGALLSNSLAGQGITEISTVFKDDMIVLEESLPWRVEMAIHRLAKDLKMVPMFKGKSDEEMRVMKVQIVEDIIRPLRHPMLLKDIVLNCYIIAKHVDFLEEEDLEQTVIDCFPVQMVLPTSRFIFEELNKLNQSMEEHPDSPVLKRRLASVKRILKHVSSRVVLEEVQGARGFMEQLYFHDIVPFHELPPEVQYRVNSIKLADDVIAFSDEYVSGIQDAKNEDDAMVLLQCFRRVAPVLIDRGSWEVILKIAKAVDRAAQSSPAFLGGAGLPAMPLIYIYHDYLPNLSSAYHVAGKDDRSVINQVFRLMGAIGVEALIKILSESQDRAVRRSAVESLIQMGDLSRRRVRELLDDPAQVWYVQRNALVILGHIGRGDEDAERVKRFLKNSQPRLREEALSAMLRLAGRAAEQEVINALEDDDTRVQRRAMASLSLIQPISEENMNALLSRISEERPKEREQARAHDLKLAQLIRTIGGMQGLPETDRVESTLLDVVSQRAEGRLKGILKKLKKTFEEDEEPVVLLAAVEVLGKMGGPDSLELLEKLSRQEDAVGKKAAEAADKLRLRTET